MVKSAEQHTLSLRTTDTLFRAQLGCEEEKSPPLDEDDYTVEVDIAFSAERMTPCAAYAADGRVSPRGVVTLYAATDEATAIAEVRPHVGARVSVAKLHPGRELRIVDCHSRHAVSPFFGISGTEPQDEMAWVNLNWAFARPLYDLTRTELYAPTQIASEWFRRAGFDGVTFKSSLGPGKNVALFDATSARPFCCSVVEVRGITIAYEASSPRRGWIEGDNS
jgi:hypothetical protein